MGCSLAFRTIGWRGGEQRPRAILSLSRCIKDFINQTKSCSPWKDILQLFPKAS